MTKKTYRTAQGRIVDLGAMMVQNEQVRAVGNMSVNARGDIIDSQDRVLATRGEQVNRKLNQQVNAQAGPIATSNRAPQQPVMTPAQQQEAAKKERQAKQIGRAHV